MNTATAAQTTNDLAIGDGVHYSGWSDTKAGTVIARSAKTITVQQDRAELLNGCNSGEPDALVAHAGGFCAHVTGTQRHDFHRDEDGAVVKFTLRANGHYVRAGEPANRGSRLKVGRVAFYDFNF